MKTLLVLAAALVLFVLGAPALEAAPAQDLADLARTMLAPGADPVGAAAGDVVLEGEGKLTDALEIVLLLAALSLLPAALISITSFTRIVIVLSFVRRSLSINELPPNPIIIGLALFLTTFVMAPVFTRAYEKAYVPYEAGTLPFEEAADVAWGELSAFLVANTRQSEIELFEELSGNVASEGEPPPFTVIVPAFVLSELKTAFQMGFLLFLPFLVIDLVVASVLLSMGMFMLPPVTISTPFKILLFVLVDGWSLVCESLVSSFVVA